MQLIAPMVDQCQKHCEKSIGSGWRSTLRATCSTPLDLAKSCVRICFGQTSPVLKLVLRFLKWIYGKSFVHTFDSHSSAIL